MRQRLLFVAAMVLLAAPAQAQLANGFGVTVAPDYRAINLDESLAANSVSLLLLPVAVVVPIGDDFVIDAYAAYAQGSVETSTETLSLSGPVDTQLRGTWAATPWARFTLGLNLPTGEGTHSAEEAEVAAMLSTDLFGFREASFGVGMGVTTGVALAHQMGDWGVGYGASYRLTGEFEPSEDTSTVYSPGDELVARIALDRNVGTGGKLTFGGTYQHYSDDEFGDNLFQPGARIRADAAYSFRAGRSTTLAFYLADFWRQQGEVSLISVPDATGEVGSQNVVLVGAGADLGGRLALSPRADFRVLTNEDGTGSGWMGSVGTGVDVGLGGVDLTPRARVMMGALQAETGEHQGMTGFEVELVAHF